MAAAAMFFCLVVGISDGDTLTASMRGLSPRQSRDAQSPSIRDRGTREGSTFGTRSRQHLAITCFGKRATVAPVAVGGGRDRYGRTIARVACAGTEANAEQFDQAWRGSMTATLSMYAAQGDARAAHRGLWADAHPVEPWERRKLRRR